MRGQQNIEYFTAEKKITVMVDTWLMSFMHFLKVDASQSLSRWRHHSYIDLTLQGLLCHALITIA